jgi:hypothetical protein
VPDSGRGHPLGRSLLLLFWALVFWGTLTAVAMAWRTVESGLADTVRRLICGAPNVTPALGRFSLVCAVIAVCTWTTVAFMLLRKRRLEESENG